MRNKKNKEFPGIPLDYENDFWICPRMLDEYWYMLNGSECRILICILRKCFGWHKEWDYISQSQFMKYTGLSKGGVIDGIEGLEKKEFIRVSASKRYGGTNKYELVMSESSDRGGTKIEQGGSKNRQGGSKNERASTKSVHTINNNNKELNINNKYIEDIHLYFLQKINSGAKLTDKAREKVAERLSEFSVEEIKIAIDAFSRDDWKMEENSHRGLAWFCRDEKDRDVMEEYVNAGKKYIDM